MSYNYFTPNYFGATDVSVIGGVSGDVIEEVVVCNIEEEVVSGNIEEEILIIDVTENTISEDVSEEIILGDISD